MTVDAAAFWTEVFSVVTDNWRAQAKRDMVDAEYFRKRAKFNTGSISPTTALALRAVGEWVRPLVVIEVGTFIGVSTKSLGHSAGAIYTCDISNDCLPCDAPIYAHPYTKSTDMFRKLLMIGARGDLFFFDGLLTDEDPDLVMRLSTKHSVYVFDDYEGEYKGVQNVRKLQPLLPKHVLIPRAGPVEQDTTLAVLVPESRL